MNFDIIQFKGQDFINEFPDFKSEFPVMASKLQSDPFYIVRVLLVDGRIRGIEFGYLEDSWRIKLPNSSPANVPAI